MKKNTNINELKELLNKTISLKQKKEIKEQIEIIREKNKIFTEQLIKSKWFGLGVTQTMKKKQATRLLLGGRVCYELDTYDILNNLVDLTRAGENKSRKGFSFVDELNKL